MRRIPLDQIKPELLEKKGKLVEAFCAGVWGGMGESGAHRSAGNQLTVLAFLSGYIPQRAFLARKYQEPETADQLWERKDLLANSYEVGTIITDHFEVLEKTEDRIVVRCGDSPRIREVRPSDGLFEMGAVIKREQGVAEFTLKSCFYQGLGKSDSDSGPMPPHMEWLHRQYTKLWMETAVLKNCVK